MQNLARHPPLVQCGPDTVRAGYSAGVSQLVTGDAVLLDLRPARVPTRMLSAMIDVTLVALVSVLREYVVRQVGGSSARQQAVTLVGIILVMFGYPVGMATLTRGRTVGAYSLGLRAVRDDGGPSGSARHSSVDCASGCWTSRSASGSAGAWCAPRSIRRASSSATCWAGRS